MKKFIKEIVVLILQLLIFYILPLYAGPTDAMGVVFITAISIFILSIVIGAISKEKIKYLYPVVIAISSLPSVYIHYCTTVLIYLVWYLVISYVGMVVGIIIGIAINKLIALCKSKACSKLLYRN